MTWLLFIFGAMVAGFVQGLTGFAFALIAMSFWVWVLAPQLAAPPAGICLGLESSDFTESGTDAAPFIQTVGTALSDCRRDRCTAWYLSVADHSSRYLQNGSRIFSGAVVPGDAA